MMNKGAENLFTEKSLQNYGKSRGEYWSIDQSRSRVLFLALVSDAVTPGSAFEVPACKKQR